MSLPTPRLPSPTFTPLPTPTGPGVKVKLMPSHSLLPGGIRPVLGLNCSPIPSLLRLVVDDRDTVMGQAKGLEAVASTLRCTMMGMAEEVDEGLGEVKTM